MNPPRSPIELLGAIGAGGVGKMEQPQREPLTEERIDALRLATGYAADLQRFTNIVRTLERAHEIGGEK